MTPRTRVPPPPDPTERPQPPAHRLDHEAVDRELNLALEAGELTSVVVGFALAAARVRGVALVV